MTTYHHSSKLPFLGYEAFRGSRANRLEFRRACHSHHSFIVAVGGRIDWLPDDIIYHSKRFTLSFPIVTCIVVSLIVTILLKLLGLGGGK